MKTLFWSQFFGGFFLFEGLTTILDLLSDAWRHKTYSPNGGGKMVIYQGIPIRNTITNKNNTKDNLSKSWYEHF